jgi:hypothetical protein
MVAVVCGHCGSGNPSKEEAMAILPKFVGARIKRREDPALIQGLGQYVDDIPMAGTLHRTFRTLFRISEAILEEPPAEQGGGAIYRRCYALQPVATTLLSP